MFGVFSIVSSTEESCKVWPLPRILAATGFKHHPGVSLDVLGERLKVRLRMAALTSA